MTLSFAGFSLLLEDPEGRAAAYIRRYSRLADFPVNCPPRKVDPNSYCQPPNNPPVPRLKLNQLYVPSGASRWSRGLFLAKASDVAEMPDKGILKIGDLFPLQNRVDGSSLPTTVGTSVESWDISGTTGMMMWRLDGIPITPYISSGQTGSDETLMIVPLVDERYWWQGATINSVAATWDALRHELAAAMVALSFDSTQDPDQYVKRSGFFGDWSADFGDTKDLLSSSTKAVPDPCVFRNGPISIGPAMDLLCWSTARRFVPYDLKSSTPTFMLRDNYGDPTLHYETAATIAAIVPEAGATADGMGNPLYEMQWTGRPGACAGGMFNQLYKTSEVPKQINVQYPDPYDVTRAPYVKSVVPGILFPFAGNSILSVRNTMIPAGGATPANQSDLDLFAGAWASNWFTLALNTFHWSWNAMPIVRMGGTEDCVIFDYPKGLTYVRSMPPNWGYEYIAQQFPGMGDRRCLPITPYVVMQQSSGNNTWFDRLHAPNPLAQRLGFNAATGHIVNAENTIYTEAPQIPLDLASLTGFVGTGDRIYTTVGQDGSNNASAPTRLALTGGRTTFKATVGASGTTISVQYVDYLGNERTFSTVYTNGTLCTFLAGTIVYGTFVESLGDAGFVILGPCCCGYGTGGGGGGTNPGQCGGECDYIGVAGSSPTGVVWSLHDGSKCPLPCTCASVDAVTAFFGYPDEVGEIVHTGMCNQ